MRLRAFGCIAAAIIEHEPVDRLRQRLLCVQGNLRKFWSAGRWPPDWGRRPGQQGCRIPPEMVAVLVGEHAAWTETYDHAFNAGVRAVLDLASRTAASIDAIVVLKPTRFNIAAEALRGLAKEGTD